MRVKTVFSMIFLGVMVCFPTTVTAVATKMEPDPISPWNRMYLGSLTLIRYHPLGLETQNRFIYSRRLIDSISPLFGDTFIGGGPSLKLSPAYLKIGPLIEFQPITVFNLRLSYEYVYFFGNFANLQSYPAGDLIFSDDNRDSTKDSAYRTGGHHLIIEPIVQAKIWKIVVRSKFGLEYWAMDIHQGDKYFYEPTLDSLVPVKKLFWTNDSDVLYMDGRLGAGVRFSGVFPSANSSHMRIGPMAAWSFHTRNYSSFNKPTIFMILGWYLKHPNREGALPYILAGFSFSSDFLLAK